MKVNIQSVNFKINDKLTQFVEEKVGKLGKFYNNALSADVSLSDDGKNGKHCDIKMVVPGNDLFVKKNAPSYEEAVASAVEAMRTVITNQKEKY